MCVYVCARMRGMCVNVCVCVVYMWYVCECLSVCEYVCMRGVCGVHICECV